MSDKPPPGHFRLLYFASATSYTKKAFDDFPAPLPVSKLFAMLEEKYTGMTQRVLSSAAITVNLEYVDLHEDAGAQVGAPSSIETVIKEGDEVAIIPPVSAG